MKNQLVIADAHVHFYDCFDMEQLFDRAYHNFHQGAEHSQKGTTFSAFLFLAETQGEIGFIGFPFRSRQRHPKPGKGGNGFFSKPKKPVPYMPV
jgi:hypothetical protein